MCCGNEAEPRWLCPTLVSPVVEAGRLVSSPVISDRGGLAPLACARADRFETSSSSGSLCRANSFLSIAGAFAPAPRRNTGDGLRSIGGGLSSAGGPTAVIGGACVLPCSAAFSSIFVSMARLTLSHHGRLWAVPRGLEALLLSSVVSVLDNEDPLVQLQTGLSNCKGKEQAALRDPD